MIDIEVPVPMCSTHDNTYWTHGWVDRTKFRGNLLSRASGASGWLEGEESPDEIIRGKVRHGWVLTVIGDTSGCGWDMTTHFEEFEPEIVEENGVRRWHDDDGVVLEYDEDDNATEMFAEVADGPHKATWWEP